MLTLACLTAAALVLTDSAPPAMARHTLKISREQKIAIARLLNQEAEKKLYAQMTAIMAWLESYRHKYGHYPQSPYEVDRCQQHLCRELYRNPFMPEETYVHQDGENPPVDQHRIRVAVDYGLSKSKLEEFKVKPPSEWFGTPGTITIVSDGREIFAVWGAGADGRPICDQDSNKPLLLCN